MRSNVAPSAARFLKYGASDVPPRICSKSLFSSTTMTMWSYTGNVAGQGGLSAASAVPAVDNATAITMQSSDVFFICFLLVDLGYCACGRGVNPALEAPPSHDGTGSVMTRLSVFLSSVGAADR